MTVDIYNFGLEVFFFLFAMFVIVRVVELIRDFSK